MTRAGTRPIYSAAGPVAGSNSPLASVKPAAVHPIEQPDNPADPLSAGGGSAVIPAPATSSILPISLAYLDKLQHENADDLAFYPLTTLEKALEAGHVIACEDNGEAAGYLWFGAVRGGRDVTIYQACVDYDSRRRLMGWDMVRRLIDVANAGGATGIRLKCASSAESNEFWIAIGFHCTRVTPGGIKRARDINHYRTDLQPGLFTLPTVEPSTKAIDLAAYHSLKRNGVSMPSRFSRTHYAVAASEARRP